MRVLVADKFEQSGLDGLAALGCEVFCEPGLKDQALAERVAELKPDVLIVRSTKVGEPVLAAGPLKLVVRAGAGYNTIDVAAASRRGIYVSNCPGKNSIAVAELAFALILALDRRIADNVISLRAGEWNKAEFSKARGLFGRTLGLLGVGNIGSQMIPRAKAFGMRVVAWSRSLSAERAEALGIERRDSPREVAATADIVSVHLALTPETRGLCDAGFFAAMKKGAYFINTARGEIVDEEALKAAIREKGIRAGLDVFAEEPAGATGEFTERDRADAGDLRHPPHRRVHRRGAGGHCGRGGADCAHVPGDRQGAECRESRPQDARHLRAGGAASGPAGRAGIGARCHQRGEDQRSGDGERGLRRGRSGGCPNQPRNHPPGGHSSNWCARPIRTSWS